MAIETSMNFIDIIGISELIIINMLFSENCNLNMMRYILLDTKYKSKWPNLLPMFINKISDDYHDDVHYKIFLLLEYDREQINDNMICKIFDIADVDIMEIAEYLISIKYAISEQIIQKIIQHGKASLYINIQKIHSNVSFEHLLLACKNCCNGIIEYCLQLKIIPTNECVTSYLERCILNESTYIHEYSIDVYVNYENLINKFFDYGIVPTYELLLKMMECRLKIHDIEKYDIKLDDKYLIKSIELRYEPYKYEFKYTHVYLEMVCKTRRLNLIKKIIESGIKPTDTCLINATKLPYNKQIITYLSQNGAKMTLECIFNTIDNTSNGTLIFVANEYKKTIEKKVI